MSTMHHVKLVAIAMATTALAASGCGGSSKSSGGATSATGGAPAGTGASARSTPLTRAELIARGDTICRRVNQKRASTTIEPQQTYASAWTPLAVYAHAAAAEMDRLTAPPSMTKDWNRMVSSAQTIADIYSTAIRYAKAGKLDETAPLTAKLARATKEMLTTAKRQGFKDCARGKV
jgi:hypothetical protein